MRIPPQLSSPRRLYSFVFCFLHTLFLGPGALGSIDHGVGKIDEWEVGEEAVGSLCEAHR